MDNNVKSRIKMTKEVSDRLIANGYKRRCITLDLFLSSLIAMVASVPFMAIVSLLYYLRNGNSFFNPKLFPNIIIIPVVVALMIVHELVHGLFYGLFTGNHWGNVILGVQWKTLTPFCTCCEPITINQYILMLLAPTMLLGLLPGLFSILMANSFLFIVSQCMLVMSGSDLLFAVRLMFLKTSGDDVLIVAHPTKSGFYCFEK